MVSAATLGNVGNCALTTGLLLTSGSRDITKAALAELTGVAVRELRTQGALSTKAVQGGSTTAAERTIIEGWRDYYIAALAKVPDISVDSADWSADIATAQEQVRRAATQVLATLAN